MSTKRIYLNVPYGEKDQAKKLGARWDTENKGWWINDNAKLEQYKKWLPRIYRQGCSTPHITSEMVPESMWYCNLRSLLPKEEWDVLRKQAYESAGYRCQVCGEKGPKWPVECNEQWQYLDDPKDKSKGIQKLLRLTALCPSCHSIKHLGKANIQGTLNKTLAQLAFVNDWSEEECRQHAEEAFDIWEQRNKKEWSLDLSVLHSLGITSLSKAQTKHANIHIDGIPIILTSCKSIFNSCAHIFRPRKVFRDECYELWETDEWKLLSLQSPIWYLDVTANPDFSDEKNLNYRIFDCTSDYYIEDDAIDQLKFFIQDCSSKGTISILITKITDIENNVAIREATNAFHPHYLLVEYEDENFSTTKYIEYADYEDIPTPDLFDAIDSGLKLEGWDTPTQTSALEFLKTKCSKCENEIYRLTGLIIPNDKNIEDWQSNFWQHRDHIPPTSFSKSLLKSTIEVVQKHPEINNLKSTPLNSSYVASCPHCDHSFSFGFFGDEDRINAYHDKDARTSNTLVYKPVGLNIDYETMNNINSSFEITGFSARVDNYPKWKFYDEG